MSRYSKVERSLWGDARFLALSAPQPCAQFLWVYLLTGPHNTSLPGLFRLRLSTLSEELGWEYVPTLAAFEELAAVGMAKHDRRAGVLWLPNAIKHNAPQSPNVVAGWRDEISLVPECDLKREAIAAMRATVEALGESFRVAMARALGEAPRMASPNPSGKGAPKALPGALVEPLVKPLVGDDQRLCPDGTKAFAQNRPIQDQDQDQDQEQEQERRGSAEGGETAPAPTANPEPPAPTDPASAPAASTASAADGKGDGAPTATDLAAAVSILTLIAEIAGDARKATPEPRKRRERKPPPPDTIPMPGTPARTIYDALTGDPVLRPIVAGPGDFAARIADPAAYPGVDVLAEVKRAAEYASRHPGQYSDGRRYLATWLSRAAERVPPKPATAPTSPASPAAVRPERRLFDPIAHAAERDAAVERLRAMRRDS